MQKRFGVTTPYYGGATFDGAEMTRALARRGVPTLQIRGCAYPEMARAEQVRQAIAADVEVLVFLDGHVSMSLGRLDQMVDLALDHGIVLGSPHVTTALECCAIRMDIVRAMRETERRRYTNCGGVEAHWGSEKVEAVPIASPWTNERQSVQPGFYLTDSQAFLHRAKAVSGLTPCDWLEVPITPRRIRYRSFNVDAPITDEPGSRFALCLPTFGALDLKQIDLVAELERAGMTVFQIHDCPWIDIARSYLTERALDIGKGVFFIDHDIHFEPNDVLRLCEQALERDAVVAGAYCMRMS